ncbi:sodium:solute symporter family protein [Kineococcus rhizosphaerae]|uniref:SSS family solute:Na+ symporter n=1 Tax=Kineococcus rhizosphaerae TaxID=559628 RepID=A0A2T0R4N3_9ACTN|nr:sodium:solute symporter family protein [Kineococcus rhizosphaerae]PRY15315.1 SSS family solute:Na+ symporter [Kineococcus rhizosphaerae]
MDMLIGYTGVALFLILVTVVMERTRRTDADFSEYATAGRSFGSFYGTAAYLNTFLPGTVFISFAGLAAASGLIGFYLVVYAVAGMVLMHVLARNVHTWGARYDLRTQSDLLGLRYRSKVVQVVSAVIGIVATIPWIVLGMQSLALVFDVLSFGALAPLGAVLVSIAVIAVRQVWTVRFGMRGIIISDLVQGLFAYGIGTLVAVGLLVWLLTHGHGFAQVPDGFTSLPGPGSDLGPLYALSLTLTGALGTWCWPDIFMRLFTARSVRTVQRTALQAAPVLLVFSTAVLLVAYLASSLPGVAEAPDRVWFTTAEVGGVLLLTVAAVCVVAATMGNVGANLQAVGTQAANDVVGVIAGTRVRSARAGKVAVALVTLVSAVGAFFTVGTTSGLVVLALVSYQGIVQLAPTLLLGVLWKRGNAVGATAGMVSGFVTAAVLQVLHPVSVPWAGGLTSGVVALVVNTAVYVTCAYALPSRSQREHVDRLWSEGAASAGDGAPAVHDVSA